MKLSDSCYECLKNLVYQAAMLATDDKRIEERAIAEGLKVLDDNFSNDEVSIVVATKLHNAIKEITRNPDPYREMKDREIAAAREIYHEVKHRYENDFRGFLELAALGNTLDFFRPLDMIKKDMRRGVKFTLDNTGRFEYRLKASRRVLYLADNAGEVFFDLPLLIWMRRFASVTYVIKASPVQNDVTIEDVRRAGLETELGDIMDTGTATPGIDFSLASDEFKSEFTGADLIFAKGMGYYESLSELEQDGNILYCLIAKCQPVADSLKVPLNSFVTI